MGGRAIDRETVRLATADMEPIGRAVATALRGRLAEWLRNKPDHGDADVIVPASTVEALGDEGMAATVARVTGFAHRHHRPDWRDPNMFVGLDTPHGLFQVDLITADDTLADFAARYISWGDLGTMIGRTAREMGLRFGQNGLRLPVLVPNAARDTVLMTADFDEALDFIGLDPIVHGRGFDDTAALLDYVSAGQHFDPKVYDPVRASADARARAKKRPGVHAIQDSLSTRKAKFEWPAVKGPNPLQDAFVERAIARFGKADEVEAMRQRLEASIVPPKESAFSLEAIAAITGLEGLDVRALGAIVKEPFLAEKRDFQSWRDAVTPQEVHERVLTATAILAERRAAEAVRAERAAQHRRNTEARRLRNSIGTKA